MTITSICLNGAAQDAALGLARAAAFRASVRAWEGQGGENPLGARGEGSVPGDDRHVCGGDAYSS